MVWKYLGAPPAGSADSRDEITRSNPFDEQRAYLARLVKLLESGAVVIDLEPHKNLPINYPALWDGRETWPECLGLKKLDHNLWQAAEGRVFRRESGTDADGNPWGRLVLEE